MPFGSIEDHKKAASRTEISIMHYDCRGGAVNKMDSPDFPVCLKDIQTL